MVPPFSRCSQGLGLAWLNENKTQLLADLGIRKEGKIIRMPRYYYNKIKELIPPELLDELTIVRFEERIEELEADGRSILELAEIDESRRRQSRYDLESKRVLSDLKAGKKISRQI